MNPAKLKFEFALSRPEFSLRVAAGLPMHGITGVFGPSGAGKTTLLRCIAGLERPDAGMLSVGEDTWFDAAANVARPVQQREVGYVFQEPRLFGHLDVRKNLCYGQSRSRSVRAASAFDDIVALLGLERLLQRTPAQLSGGEAQRVAIGRALLRAPTLLLMDEPLASLDLARKNEILPFLDRLHAELETPVIYVSHNVEEICRLCDYLVVMDGGELAADGDLQNVLARIDVPLLAGHEAGAVIIGEVSAYDAQYDLTRIRFSGGELRVPGRHGVTGKELRLRVRANDISLCRDRPMATTILNVLRADIDEIQEATGPSCLLRLMLGDDVLVARITRRSLEELGLQIGDTVFAQVKAVAVRGS